jgi:hypothetical protein
VYYQCHENEENQVTTTEIHDVIVMKEAMPKWKYSSEKYLLAIY